MSNVVSETTHSELAASSLHVIRSGAIGGIERQAQEFSAELARLGAAQELWILSIDPVDASVVAWHERRIPVRVIDDRRGACFGIGRLVSLWRRFRAREEAIVHFHYALPHGLIWNELWAAKLAGKRVVATLHHTIVWPKITGANRIKQWLARRAIDAFTVTTHHALGLAGAALGPERVWRVPCCVPGGKASEEQIQAARDALGLTASQRLVVTLGRTVREKGVFDVADVAEGWPAESPETVFLIAGSGPAAEAIAQRAAAAERLRYVGRVEDADALLAAADLFLLPSYEEGFGLVFAEAGVQQTPSVAYDLPTVREVVTPGEAGWLAPVGDIKKLTETVHGALANDEERRRRGLEAARVAAEYSPQVVLPALLAVYQSLTPQPTRDPALKDSDRVRAATRLGDHPSQAIAMFAVGFVASFFLRLSILRRRHDSGTFRAALCPGGRAIEPPRGRD
ncbi:putative teichuronic acid biosynthesis glycosyltransferase TuaC [Botrimarina colliarenosi]|uniref:Putative teichuronic acid biosynthesis glycosyltransferase TuaC n=1 Tax=Botrimarina colliarenosi TaxID=2528001 RepID=A0A5C6AF74_9BACT|nr:glycosyltransferase [Botrimarina colliarenosi]TWT97968.1 putative teichuronic acid biosynthesis glycosyltransferase TuaC [Botrimarina colliarenosi]